MKNNPAIKLGFYKDKNERSTANKHLLEYANLKLASRGLPTYGKAEDNPFLDIGQSLLKSIREKNRLLQDHLCPIDQRIQTFLESFLGDEVEEGELLVPVGTLTLDRHGLARTFSLPPDSDSFKSDIVSSYRVKQGVCHNPQKDRRTTKGVFHIVDGSGLPTPLDKKEVPKKVFANLLRRALNPPEELLRLPFTSTQEEEAHSFVSLLLRPIVSPEVPGVMPEKTLETRFFAPGNLVSNLDFVESIFGNAGDPRLTENDAQLDAEHWTGHTGYVILAPHLIYETKKSLGLPNIADATERQKTEGMYWEKEDELYNDGGAFKITARNSEGVVTTIIADNYFGYCKKEVKTQISYSANLYGMAEEEHAGGALAFPSFDLGEEFDMKTVQREHDHTFEEVLERYTDIMDVHPEGYGIDKQFSDIYYIPENVRLSIREKQISWEKNGEAKNIKLLPEITYMLPSGYKIKMEKPEHATRWRLVGTQAEGTFCHKPCTVSGGGKSEISKPISDAMISGSVYVKNFKEDFALVDEILSKDYGKRYQNPREPGRKSRPILSMERSFGSAVKLLSYHPEYTDEYNEWVSKIPRTVRDMVFVIKKFYKAHWYGQDWKERFRVDIVNGYPGHELKYHKRTLKAQVLRVGFTEEGNWRTFGLRKDFCAADKLQLEDDISASITLPREQVNYLHPGLIQESIKYVVNCENRLFQRPDEAIVRGYDKQAEKDFTKEYNFFSNYEPLSREFAEDLIEDAVRFDEFTTPIQKLIKRFVKEKKPDYLISTAHPRLVDGVPTKNPRYLQDRPDYEDPRDYYLGNLGARLQRRVPLGQSVPFPVNSVLTGRRNNPPEKEAGIRALAVYNPIHYQELPELFMDFIASLTGKSPSTTGAGTEGALTKNPFNCLPQIFDLNNALVSYILTGDPVYSSSAGHIGPKYRVDHDISLLIPEVWSRMYINERDPDYLIEQGCLEKIEDFEHKGQKVLASRLGYRITEKFMITFFGRIFSDPTTVFDEEMLRPELQDMDVFADGVANVIEAQCRVAENYIKDGQVELACPPLKALIYIMAEGNYEGKDVEHPEVRALFEKEYMLNSDWYKARLDCKQSREIISADKRLAYLEAFAADELNADQLEPHRIHEKISKEKEILELVNSPAYLDQLQGTLGTDPGLFG